MNVLDAGIDTIIHGDNREPDGSEVFRPEIADRIAEQGVYVNKTIGGSVAGMRILEAESNLSPEMQDQLDEMRRSSEMRLDHFARMREAGVMMAAGSDSAWGFIHRSGNALPLQPFHQGGDAVSGIVETFRRAVINPYLEADFAYVDSSHYYHRVLLIRIIALSASPLVNAGPRPLYLFGVSDWREGCLTPTRHDQGYSPVRPMTATFSSVGPMKPG